MKADTIQNKKWKPAAETGTDVSFLLPMLNHNKITSEFLLHLGDLLLELVHYNKNFVTEKLLIIILHAIATPSAT